MDIKHELIVPTQERPKFGVERVYGSVVEDDPDFAAYRELLDCDVILHAADGHWTTQVLDEIAHTHLIPVISGGTRPETTDDGPLKDTSKSPITVSGPSHPCFRCALHYLPNQAEEERHGGRPPGPDYNVEDKSSTDSDGDSDAPAPSVISLNSIVAGMMHLRLQDLTLGVTGHIAGERRFMPAKWDFERGRDACREDCDRKDIVAAGENHIFSLSADHEFKKVREQVSVRFTPYW